jgi:IclR family acetate operon transcriptional repressor
MDQPVSMLDRILAILDQFTDEHPHLTLSEISRGAGLTTTTTHRLLTSLQERDVLRRLEDRHYALGPRLLRLASNARSQMDLREIASPIMRWLRDCTGETVGLHAVDGLDRVVLSQVESREPLRRTYTDLGTPIPLNQGAPSKAILAFLRDDLREQVIRGPLRAATENTLVESERLRDQLTAIRRQGYALSFGEREPQIASVSVPVFDHLQGVIGSLSVTGPDVRLSRARLEELAPVAVEAGERLSAALGARLGGDGGMRMPTTDDLHHRG